MGIVKPGRYRHFKGNEYEVLYSATHSETGEEMVVYRALYGEGNLWVRPAAMWNEEVTRDGVTCPRFLYLEEDMTKEEQHLQLILQEIAEEKYGDFMAKLIPTVDRDKILGVRVPTLRKLASSYAKNPDLTSAFLSALPHTYLEENYFHAFLLDGIRDFDTLISELDRFLPYVDNWAVCDSMKPCELGKHKKELEKKAAEWIRADGEYTVRFGVNVLLRWFLEEDFREEHLSWVAAIRRDEFYVKTAVALYFATALARQYDAAVPYLEKHLLPSEIHKMTIRKACESDRISSEIKQYLKTLR